MPRLTTTHDFVLTAECLESVHQRLEQVLLGEMTEAGHWEGFLAGSALSTAVASFALSRFDPEGHQRQIAAGRKWLTDNQNADGSWGDTTDSPGNLATTLLSLAALEGVKTSGIAHTRETARHWLARQFGGDDPETLRAAVIAFYGGDRTFSAPILALCTAAGLFGKPDYAAWQQVPQLPFELSIMPHQLWPHLRLAVVSYAIPALITIGLVRHRHGGTRWCPLYRLRELVIEPALKVLTNAQPDSGGYLEAAPLTGFVTMALSVAGLRDHPVAHNGARFLRENQRDDGSWPIDTNLATWLTTLSLKALRPESLSDPQKERVTRWLLDQQHLVEHPFTHAAPGGWAWTDLSGGVPDADDTSGALVALRKLAGIDPSPEVRQAAVRAVRWLCDLQNADGGIPTFCRGWGKLPFDQSCPDITAHAIRAWTTWLPDLPADLQLRARRALDRALDYMKSSQHPDGSWVPLWFGNQRVESHENPVFGTAQALLSLAEAANPRVEKNLRKGEQYLLQAQNPDGSWGAQAGLSPTIEETAISLSALCACATNTPETVQARERAATWLTQVAQNNLETHGSLPAAPIGLYFASLWYHERLYPLIFSIEALKRFAEITQSQFSISKQ